MPDGASAQTPPETPPQQPTGADTLTGQAPPPQQQQQQQSPPPEGQGAGAPSWLDGIADKELRGLAEAKGWQGPEQALKSYRELERFRGVPEDRLLKLPSDRSDTEAMDAVYRKLGRPDTADGYTLDGKPYDDNSAWARDVFHGARLTNDQAAKVLEGWNGHLDQVIEAQREEFARQVQVDVQELRREWGQAYEAKLDHGRAALRASGVSAEEARMLVSFFSLVMFTSRSASRLFSPTIIPS